MALDAQALLDGLAHALLHDVDVVVVQPQVAHAVLDQTPPANWILILDQFAKAKGNLKRNFVALKRP